MINSTQAAIERFTARGGIIQHIPAGTRNYNERDMKGACRGDDISEAEAHAAERALRFADVPDENLSSGFRMDFNGDSETCTLLA